jgi:hypothetical protein
MAYGNWGAFVYKNGVRQTNREDNTPFKEDELQPGYHQAFGRVDTKLDPHHASLGSGPFRLCGYKSSPYLFWEGNAVDDRPYQKGDNAGTDDWSWYDSEGIEGELNGYKFRATPHEYPEAVELWVQEPDGTQWTGKSGYGMGAGWE